MASAHWQSALGFSGRLDSINKITSAYHDCYPSTPYADARREANLIETRIYDEATSLHEYHRLISLSVEELLQNVQQPIQLEEDPAPVPLMPGIDIGRYTNAHYRAEGLFSVVYIAEIRVDDTYFASLAPASGRVVALKVTTPSMMQPPHDSRREARILARAASDNVIPLLESFRDKGTNFVLVFPFVPYVFDNLLRDRKLSKTQTKSCLRDVFSALAFIHSHGIIHRDVKPSNILVESLDGPAYLSDFGIAWAPNDPGSEPPDSKITDVGTTSYRAPGLLFGNKQYGCSLDLWAAGCTVAEAVVPGHPTLFDSGELGSDLALIKSIFTKLGTPDLTVWPEAANFPDWGKMQFREFPKQEWTALLPNTSETERDLVSQLVRYESGSRLNAAQALKHPYFTQ